MRDTFKKGLTIGLGLAASSKEQVDQVVDELRNKGELTKEESNSLLNELRVKGEKTQEEWESNIQDKMKKRLEEIGVPTKEEHQALEARVAELEKKLAASESE
ncbi:phasin family protein [Halalkalibacillus halophilus]|uniref:phasin family protein n=1 Tax=Halalkalibacillus halophilus TaxID=392827 RepID=UPI0003FC9454|nr:phasin family protein [Halalkalibacillus halophilus]